MARSQSTLQLQIDLDRFSRLCEYVEESSHTLTEIARRLGLSTAGMSRCLERLASRYGTLTDIVKKHVIVTSTGRALNAAYHQTIVTHVNEFDRHFRVHSRPDNTVCLGALPFVLAHIMPFAINDFLDRHRVNGTGMWSSWRKEGVHISCEEAYHVEPTLERVATEAIDCAIIWNHEGRERKILERKGLTCLKASQPLDAVVVFGRDHKFTKRLGSGQAFVQIDELSKEPLFVLEEGHQPLARMLLPVDSTAGGKRIEQTSILSMISAIRTGDPGVAIIASVFPALDRYRRDGSLFFLPLKGPEEDNTSWDVLYVIKHRKPEKDKWRDAPRFTPEAFEQAAGLEEDAHGHDNTTGHRLAITKNFLKHLDGLMKDKLFTESGWSLPVLSGNNGPGSIDDALFAIYNALFTYQYAYYVTADRVGFTTPVWVQSKLKWAKEDKADASTKCPDYEGVQEIEKSDDGRPAATYKLKARLVGNQLICIRGHRLDPYGVRTDSDSFVANLYLIPREGGRIFGVWSGRDDSGQSALTAPFVLTQNLLDIGELRHASYSIMLRTLTDVRALPPRSEEDADRSGTEE